MDHIPKAVRGNVGEVLDQKDERDKKAELCADLELNQVTDVMLRLFLVNFLLMVQRQCRFSKVINIVFLMVLILFEGC